jgi:hypothetical protein
MMPDEITIRRVDHKSFELTMDGKPVTIKSGCCPKKMPMSYGTIDHLFGAAKGLYGALVKGEK